MSIQIFQNESFKIRTLKENGEIWFVAKDIAQALEYGENTINNALGSLFQSVPKIWTDKKRIFVRSENGIEQEREMLCLTEHGLYFFLGRSDKPKALPYQMWIAGDVVPSIRKTGSYGEKSLSVANEIIPMTERILSAAGIKGNQLALALDRTAKHYTGVSLLELSGVQLEAPVKEQALNPTQIGELIGGLKARQVNEILAGMGFQHKIAGKWEPLEPGMPYAVILDVGKKHSNGIPVRYLNWNSSVVKEVKKYVERTGTED
ncbi:MAG: hypothetical protein IJQ57_09225 [Synergistaceae bacterium]|nr:hypothetical protein [Synergistaceae bacterium]